MGSGGAEMKTDDAWLHGVIAGILRQRDHAHALMVTGVRALQSRIAELERENAMLRRCAEHRAAEERKS